MLLTEGVLDIGTVYELFLLIFLLISIDNDFIIILCTRLHLIMPHV